MLIQSDLFSFAYIPSWLDQLDILASLALPEPWKFVCPQYVSKNPDTPILERYVHFVFKKQAIEYLNAPNPYEADKVFYIRNEVACFHTGIYTRNYKGIYMCFERNKRKDTLLDWFFRGWADENSPLLRYTEPLPERPSYAAWEYGRTYCPEWDIRVNIDHILGDADNIARLPESVREAWNLPLLLETAVELGRRRAIVYPSLVVPQGYQGRIQYLLPIYLTSETRPDLAMALSVMDGYYIGHTCLTLEMSYSNARLLARPTASWLTELVSISVKERTENVEGDTVPPVQSQAV